MNLSHVQTFVVAVETGNLNRAAAKLNVTQSTVTARIDALENLIGQKLLHRNKSGTELTPAGAKFLRHAEMLMQVWKQARYETSLPRGFEDVLALACDPHLWTGVAELWVRDLRQARQTIAISVEDRPGPAMVDIVFSYTPALSGFAVDVVGEDMFIEVATVPRGLMRWDPLYVYVDLGEDFRRQHIRAFPVDETAIVTFSSSAQALDHIMSCGGSAYLPYRVARPHMETGKLFEVSGAPRFTRTIYLGRNTARTEAWPWFGEFMQGFKRKLHSNIVIPAQAGTQ